MKDSYEDWIDARMKVVGVGPWRERDIEACWKDQQSKIEKLRKYIKVNDICICDKSHDYTCEKCEILS